MSPKLSNNVNTSDPMDASKPNAVTHKEFNVRRLLERGRTTPPFREAVFTCNEDEMLFSLVFLRNRMGPGVSALGESGRGVPVGVLKVREGMARTRRALLGVLLLLFLSLYFFKVGSCMMSVGNKCWILQFKYFLTRFF